MRLPPIAPASLTPEQRALSDDMRAGIATGYQGFITERADGALLGPWNPWLHQPDIGAAVWALTKALSAQTVLSSSVRQVAILVVGARFKAAYELYAHLAIAAQDGISESKLTTITCGHRPPGMTTDEALAYDIASVLSAGGVLPDPAYHRAVAAWGDRGMAELASLIGLYCMVSVTLNAYNVPVPERTPT